MLDDFDRRIDELEIKSESNLRDIKALDKRAAEYNDLVKNSLDDVVNIPANIV